MEHFSRKFVFMRHTMILVVTKYMVSNKINHMSYLTCPHNPLQSGFIKSLNAKSVNRGMKDAEKLMSFNTTIFFSTVCPIKPAPVLEITTLFPSAVFHFPAKSSVTSWAKVMALVNNAHNRTTIFLYPINLSGNCLNKIT